MAREEELLVAKMPILLLFGIQFGKEQDPGPLGHCLSLGCYSKYYRLGGSNKRPLFLTVLGAEKSKIRVPADFVSGESLGAATFLLCPHMAFPRCV